MDGYERALLESVNDKLNRVLHLLRDLKKQGDLMSAEMDRLEKSVAAEGDVVTSVEVAMAGLSQQLKAAIAAGADPVKLTAMADEIDAFKSRMSAAVVANTSTPPPAPPVTPPAKKTP